MNSKNRSPSQIEKDFRKLFELAKNDPSIYSWSELARVSDMSRSKVLTSFKYHDRAAGMCENLFRSRVKSAVIIVDTSVLVENLGSLLDLNFIVPGPVFHYLKYLMNSGNEKAAYAYNCITTMRVNKEKFNPKLGRKVSFQTWWGTIESEDYRSLPIEPAKRIYNSDRSVITKAINYMEAGENVIIFTSSYHIVNLIKLQTDQTLPYKKQIHIHFKFIPPTSG